MKKVLDFLKPKVTFFVLLAIALVFYLIALFGGEYQKITYHLQTTHYTFLNGNETGVPLALAFVIIPIICLVGMTVLFFLKPKKKDGKKATIFVASFIILATLAGLLVGLIPAAFLSQSEPALVTFSDWSGQASERVFYVKEFGFPYLSMVLCLFATIVLGCYSASTLSD